MPHTHTQFVHLRFSVYKLVLVNGPLTLLSDLRAPLSDLRALLSEPPAVLLGPPALLPSLEKATASGCFQDESGTNRSPEDKLDLTSPRKKQQRLVGVN